MGADKVIAQFTSNVKLDLTVDDYIIHNGLNYRLKDAPEVNKSDRTTFEYELTFYSPNYDLYDKLIIDEGKTRFSYTGNAFDLLSLILTNIQSLDSSWSLGSVSSLADVKTFSFNEQSCRTALTQVAEAFGLEYYIVGKAIHLVDSAGVDTAITFQYGRGNGLYELSRIIQDQPFATRWYCYGGSQNIPIAYRNALGRLTTDNSPYDANVGVYGIKEGSITFDDIFPRFEGTVESIDGNDAILDSTIDFDLNDLFISEGAAKIVFKTGDLAGNEFVITSYNHTTKKVNFGQTEDESGYILPNDTVNPSAGDTYTFVGIEMPESYITNAEAELEAKVQEYIAKQSSPKVAYDLEVDEKYIKSNSISLNVGDRVRITDADLAVDELIRIQSIEYPLVNVNQVKVVLSSDLIYTEQERIVKDVREAQQNIDISIQDAVFGRKVADEIRNYAIVNQFLKTLVGERAVMSGAFVAGNPSGGGRAGVNGAGTETDEVRFFAGSDYDNRETAPYRVLDDGSVLASMLTVLDGSVLLGGVQIGNLFIDDEGFIRSADYNPNNRQGTKVDEDGVVASGSEAQYNEVFQSVTLKGSLLGFTDKTDAANTYSGVIGISQEDLENAILFPGTKAVGVLASSLRVVSGKYENIKQIFGAATVQAGIYDRHLIVVNGSVPTDNLSLPYNPDHGFVLDVKNKTGKNLNVLASGSDDFENDSGTTIVVLGNDATTKFVYWRNLQTWYQF